MSEPTNFLESNALLAIQRDDDEHAKEILRTMLPNELRHLYQSADYLAYLARRIEENYEQRASTT